MYVVTVTFTLAPDAHRAFLPLMLDNARNSLSQEEGCVQFDVCTDPSRPEDVFLYEVYQDRAAFEVHLASDHFVAFDAATAGMVVDKSVKLYEERHT